jgi:hypothetical protein
VFQPPLGAYAPMEHARGQQHDPQRDRRDDGEPNDCYQKRTPSGPRDPADVGVESHSGKGQRERPLRHVCQVCGSPFGQPARGCDRRDRQKAEYEFREFVLDEFRLGSGAGRSHRPAHARPDTARIRARRTRSAGRGRTDYLPLRKTNRRENWCNTLDYVHVNTIIVRCWPLPCHRWRAGLSGPRYAMSVCLRACRSIKYSRDL